MTLKTFLLHALFGKTLYYMDWVVCKGTVLGVADNLDLPVLTIGKNPCTIKLEQVRSFRPYITISKAPPNERIAFPTE